jgi:hypothetical protein
MKTLLNYIAYAVVGLFLVFVGGSMPEHAAHVYFTLLTFCIGTFISFKGRAWHHKHKAERDEMIRAVREGREPGIKS